MSAIENSKDALFLFLFVNLGMGAIVSLAYFWLKVIDQIVR